MSSNIDDKVMKTLYRRLVGILIYFNIIRPNISYVVEVISQFMFDPRESNWHVVSQVTIYMNFF
ncbi:hypothetical protein O6H91_04G126400 [Diphasiastrum complanatum]|uniref:Uncharacterized protein n=1 Tax=Diphasiastrum complanatum TaxID=34168 RepID=A0ACC2E1I8_DIPCM|nr:hypothetical protein O6H91_04G126400 [Diphasiastrum complanatum]